jgi:hypothetical protein
MMGRCLCETVRYELAGELGPIFNCHCRFCRRAHGAAFACVAWVASAALRVLAGGSSIREFRTEGVGSRYFCERCGTRLWNRAESTLAFVSLVVGSLDADPARGAIMHINVESKAGWYEILDGLPQHLTLPAEARRVLGK